MTWLNKVRGQLIAALKRSRRPIVCLFFSIAITFGLEKLFPDVYAPLDLYEFDLLAQTLTEKDTYSRKIVLVTIGDDEYKDYFGRHSPLNPYQVRVFINAILSFEPSVVGVDLITDHWDDLLRDFNNDHHYSNGGARVTDRAPVRIVWAATTPAVARVSSPSTPPFPCFAIPQYKQDQDGTIRTQVLAVDSVPSFALAVSRSAESESCGAAESGQEGEPDEGKGDERIRFTGSNHLFRRFAAAKVLTDTYEGERPAEPSPLEQELKGAIVLLGGTFKEARDSYKTPIGEMDGVEILAHAVESIDNSIEEWDKWAVALLEFVIGTTVILGLARVRPRWLRSFLMIAAPLVLGVVVSFYAFQYLGNVIAVAASFLGIPIGHFAEDWLGDQLENENETGGDGRQSPQEKT